MGRKEYSPKLRLTIEFCDNDEESMDAFVNAIKTVINAEENVVSINNQTT
ncbi:hypothetical protein KKF55_04120 [Patescibacteria group bacterium]|nr:hypothetical protein [Patescibacteria group bacterium]